MRKDYISDKKPWTIQIIEQCVDLTIENNNINSYHLQSCNFENKFV